MADDKKGLVFEPALDEFISSREKAAYTTLSGANNSGKSLVMKNMRARMDKDAYMVGPQRFYHVYELSTQRYALTDYDNWNNQAKAHIGNEETNHEQNYIDLGRILGSLKDAKRNKLFSLCGELIGAKFSLAKRDPENEMSPRFVDMDGRNLSVASTGTRLLMTLLGLCMDDQFSIMLIDEPELGLSPRVQRALAEFLANRTRRAKFFPHLDRVVVATHSHLFLDRAEIGNNFIVNRDGDNVKLSKIETMSELHELQFNMLGNTMETLFLPSAIVICEGKTDKPYFEKITSLKFPDQNIVVSDSKGDVKKVFNSLKSTLGDIQKSPFRDRTFIILDSVHTAGTKDSLIKMGACDDNIIIWNKNGVEYIYPPEILSSIFSCSEERLSEIEISDDNVSLNGITQRKTDLSQSVIKAINSETIFPDEVVEKFIEPLAVASGARPK
jgi:predicted ATPase